jgi:hypothetical protein
LSHIDKDRLKDKTFARKRKSETSLTAPLADPVLTAIFRNKHVSGLAIRSFSNAILAHSGGKLIGEVDILIPQYVMTSPGGRSHRMDVVSKTADNEFVIFESQLGRFKFMNERCYIYALQLMDAKVERGAKLAEALARLPRVINLNILDFVLMDKGGRFHEVVESVYRYGPRDVALPNHQVHPLQLPMFEREKFDPTIPLHCWLKALVSAQRQETLLSEVVEMDQKLQEFYLADEGFQQLPAARGPPRRGVGDR